MVATRRYETRRDSTTLRGSDEMRRESTTLRGNDETRRDEESPHCVGIRGLGSRRGKRAFRYSEVELRTLELKRREIDWRKLATTGGLYIRTRGRGRTIETMLHYYTTKRETWRTNNKRGSVDLGEGVSRLRGGGKGTCGRGHLGHPFDHGCREAKKGGLKGVAVRSRRGNHVIDAIGGLSDEAVDGRLGSDVTRPMGCERI